MEGRERAGDGSLVVLSKEARLGKKKISQANLTGSCRYRGDGMETLHGESPVTAQCSSTGQRQRSASYLARTERCGGAVCVEGGIERRKAAVFDLASPVPKIPFAC